MIKPQLFTARLGHIEKISSKVYLKRFDLISPNTIQFIPGQTVMLRVAQGINRSMSIASPPTETTSITVVHDVSPMGPYSKWTIAAKVGDEMKFMGPLGAFVVDWQSTRKKVFVATGTGVAPFHSIILDACSRQSAVSHKLSLYWGIRYPEDIFWRSEFEELAKEHPWFTFHLILSKPGPGWTGMRGHVTECVLSMEQNLAANDYYLCGNKSMIAEVRSALESREVPKEQIKSELFY